MTLTPKPSTDYFVRQAIVGAISGGIGLMLVYMGLRRHMWPMTAFGAFAMTFWTAVAYWTYRQGPRSMDRETVTRRDGRRFSWKDLTEKRDIHGRIPGGELGPLNHVQLIFPTGKVRVFPMTLENAGEVMAFMTRRTTPCKVCGTLGDYYRGFQKGGREAEDGLLQKCPECGDHFLYQSTYEFLISGSEDEQILTRVVM